MDEQNPNSIISPVPWEQRDRIGFFNALWQTIKQAALQPGNFFSRVNVAGPLKGPLVFYFGISLFVFMISTLFSSVLPPKDLAPLGPGKMLLLSFLFLFVGIFLEAGVVHLFVKGFGGKDGYRATLIVMAYASAVAPLSLIPYAGGLISSVWMIFIAVQGLKVIHKMSLGRAIAAYLLFPVVIMVIIGIFVAVSTYQQSARDAELRRSAQVDTPISAQPLK